MIRLTAAIPDAVAVPVPALLDEVRSRAVAVLSRWGRTGDGIGLRFQARAFGLYGYTTRSEQYRLRHPEPYVASGAFRSGILSGTGSRIAATPAGSDGFRATLVSPAARALNFRRAGGIYADEWARLHPTEADVIDDRVQDDLDRVEVPRG